MKSSFNSKLFLFLIMAATNEKVFIIGTDYVLSEGSSPSLHTVINHLINNGTSLNIIDRMGRTLAHRAAEIGDLESLLLLKQNEVGHLVNLTDSLGQSPLHLAATNNKDRIIEFLACQGVDLNSEDYYRRTPLHRAAENGQLEALKMLIDKGAEMNRKIRYFDMTAMHLAARTDHLDIIRELAERNHSINLRDAEERTPLWHAVAANRINSVKELIGLGADITSMIIWEAVDRGYLPIVKYLILKGANVNAKADTDSSLLVRAAYRNHLDTAKFLIDKGIDVRGICCYTRWTPLHEAALHDRVAMAKLFLDRGADINAVDRTGFTPLDVAGPAVNRVLSERGAKSGSQLKISNTIM